VLPELVLLREQTDTLVVPAGKNVFAMELLLAPAIGRLIERRNQIRAEC
jgi:phosphoribulokinase